ncbi:hypothetical protein EVAR_99403_1 [Eumeta japonica]|uniref:Uncharacterized protein n=1 Tax=Eumeta variegata TaxID=151549 RepID=A0A4C1ZTP5_EUMVA|nr:hypothetical protein EVAR_99403_1 [Eumeta japonica]
MDDEVKKSGLLAVFRSHDKKRSGKKKGLVIIYAGSENGFVPNALLLFKAGTKFGDYHDYMNYEKWLHSQLMPNLPANSIVIVDNA